MERRRLQFADMNAAVRDARELAASGYERAGNWSLAEVLDHLNKTLAMTFDPPPFKGPPGFLRPLLKWFVYGKMKRGEVIKFRASAPAGLQPAPDLDLDERLAEFERLGLALESGERETLPVHPFFGKFTRDEWLILHRWHSGHHLSFLVPTEDAG